MNGGSWHCPDCGCLNADHEAFCYRCGAGQPDDGGEYEHDGEPFDERTLQELGEP